MLAQHAISGTRPQMPPRWEEPGRASLPVRPEVQERLDLSRATARRRWILRTTIMLFMTGAVLFMIVTVQRDRTGASNALRVLVPLQQELTTQLARLGQLPADLPEPFQQAAYAYAGDGERLLIREGTFPGPILVASTGRIRQILRPDGYGVLIWEKGNLELRWMSRGEYVRQIRYQERAVQEFEEHRQARLNYAP